ncbi:MAG TPA: hypothetical protein VGM25_00520 [Caulobacteraceae bacterium]|jgi:hypothetical protein
MRRPPALPVISVLAAALALAGCGKSAAQAAAAPTPAANSSAPVKWDFASKDPAKNPDVANQESAAPGYNP